LKLFFHHHFRKASLYEAECLQLSAEKAAEAGDLVSQFKARNAKKAAETLGIA
jgi:hypothetical protein